MSLAQGGPAPVDRGTPAPAPSRPVKPRARGWIHLVTAPLAFVVGLALVATAPTFGGRIACAVFALTAVQMFTTSAVYHRGVWSDRLGVLLRRLDHTNIFLLIAGTYTPLAVMLLPSRTATVLLAVVWGGALLGTLSRLFWLSAPRWVYTPVYVALGWVAVWFMPDFWRAAGPGVVVLLVVGGLAYTAGAVVYALRRPDPAPRVFGFHEIFHVGTVIGWACHAGSVALASLATAGAH